MTSADELKLARAFSRLGWIGFWIQAALFIVPIVALVYVLSSRAGGSGVPLRFINYLASAGVAIMVFTTFWSYRYTRLAGRMRDPVARPGWIKVARTLWIGLLAAFLGVIVSLSLLIREVWGLLLLLLRAPQGGVPVMQTSADDRTSWVSTINVISLLAELCTLVGEVLFLGISLWLLHKLVTRFGSFNADRADAELTRTAVETS
jgi:hypothetical protein